MYFHNLAEKFELFCLLDYVPNQSHLEVNAAISILVKDPEQLVQEILSRFTLEDFFKNMNVINVKNTTFI